MNATVPGPAPRHLEAGARGGVPETPKPGDTAFERTRTVIVGNNARALEAAREKAQELGYHTLVLSTLMEGETRDVARVHAAIAWEILAGGNPVPRPACIPSGGETTVTIRGRGRGGRNHGCRRRLGRPHHGAAGPGGGPGRRGHATGERLLHVLPGRG